MSIPAISFTELLKSSYAKTKDFFFNPFSLKKLLLLFFVGLFSGMLSAGINFSFNFNNNSSNSSNRSVNQEQSNIQAGDPASSSLDVNNEGTELAPESERIELELADEGEPSLKDKAGLFFDDVKSRLTGEYKPLTFHAYDIFISLSQIPRLIVGGVVAVVSFIMLLLFFVSAFFSFVWWSALETGVILFKETYSRFKVRIRHLFSFNVLIMIGYFLLMGFFVEVLFKSVHVPISEGKDFQWSLAFILKGFGVPFVVFFFVTIGFVLFSVYLKRICVPLVYLKDCSFFSGLKEGLLFIKTRFKKTAIFLALFIVLFAGLGVVKTILIVLLGLVIGIVGLLLAGLLFLLFFKLMGLKLVFFIIAGLAAVPIVVSFMIVFALMSLAVGVYVGFFNIDFTKAIVDTDQKQIDCS